MILYIVRHAEAVEVGEATQDEWRYLTEKGRSAVKKLRSIIGKSGPKPRMTITSPLTRAVQTAEIMAEKACRKNVVFASNLLLPGGDVGEVISCLKSCKEAKRVMLVGHEPQLGLLAATLLGRKDGPVSLKKGSCVSLKLDLDNNDKMAAFLWYGPGKKSTSSFKKAFPQITAPTDAAKD